VFDPVLVHLRQLTPGERRGPQAGTDRRAGIDYGALRQQLRQPVSTLSTINNLPGSGMGYWRRHPRKDLEDVLVVFHQAGWLIEDTGTYYRMKCSCGNHQRSIHLTPSNPHYGRQALSWMRRQPCVTSGGA
jgi:hypothetical protein